jgi:lipopolysaccharide export system permease protein
MIIERYIGRTVATGILLAMTVVIVLLALFGFIDELEDVGIGEYGVLDAFLFALMSVPRYTFEAFPIAALIGSLVGLGTLASNSELTAMRAAGISVRRILLAIFKTGLVLMIVVAVLGEVVAPVVQEKAQLRRAELQHGQVLLRSRYGFWARDGDAFVNIRTILPGSGLRDIHIYEFNDRRQLELVTHADRADFVDERWVLHDLQQTRISTSGVETRQLEQAAWDSVLEPSLLRAIVVDPGLLSAWTLYQYLQFMRENGLDVPAYEVAFWSKVVAPLATLVMLFLGVPFVFGSLRSVGIGQRLFAGMLIGSTFFLLNRLLAYLAVVYHINPLLAAALPAVAFLTAGAVFLRRVR